MTLDRRRLLLHAFSVASGIGAALFGAAVLRGDVFPPSPPPGYVAARADGYTVYAPSPSALSDALDEVRWARQTFGASFASEPGDMVVVVADSPAAFRRMDLGAVRRRGSAFLPYVTREYIALPSSGDELLSLDDGVVLERMDGALQVGASGRGGARRAGLRKGDQVVRLNGVPASAIDSVRRRVQEIPTGGPMRLQVRRNGAVLRIEYPKGTVDHGAAQAHAVAVGRLRAETKSLAHEVCHQLVAQHAGGSFFGRPTGDGYGHPRLPDWVDEMAAVLCESAESRHRRRTYLHNHVTARIPLAEFTRMNHPAAAALSVRIAREGQPGPGGTPVIMLGAEEARALMRNLNVPMFYAQAMSLGEFILARGGPTALRTVTDQLADGRTLEQALSRAARDAPSLPTVLSGFESEWVRWVESGGGT